MGYLAFLSQQATAHGLEILGYCLMTNHIHLIVTPHSEQALAKGIGRTHYRYTQYINHLHGRSGHLWQNRFHSCPMDEYHMLRALRYIEQNPVRAGMVRVAWRYRWSSAMAHCGGKDPSGLLDLRSWARRWPGERWKAELQSPEDADESRKLKHCLMTGRPLASDSYISKLEAALGHRLRARRVGRPRKEKIEIGVQNG